MAQETLPVDKEKVLELYKKANKANKVYLEEIFGKSLFAGNILDRVKSMDDVYHELGLKKGTKLIEKIHPILVKHTKAIEAFPNIILATEVINEGWIANYKDSSQPKFELWWDLSCSGLSLDGVGRRYANSDAGSRLVFETEEKARHAAKHFLPAYTDFIIIPS